jgi:hypothetical protein
VPSERHILASPRGTLAVRVATTERQRGHMRCSDMMGCAIATLLISCVVSDAPLTEKVFALVDTDSSSVRTLTAVVRQCSSTVPPVESLLRDVSMGRPIRATASFGNLAVIGVPIDELASRPHLILDLTDLLRLPPDSETATWAMDSSWALTRCEALAHEIEEARVVAWQWVKADTAASARSLKQLRGLAHDAGLRMEDRIREAKSDRHPGLKPRGQVRSCFRHDTVHRVSGFGTESFRLDSQLNIVAVSYARGVALCDEAPATAEAGMDSIGHQ